MRLTYIPYTKTHSSFQYCRHQSIIFMQLESFFGNANETKNAIINFANKRYGVSAWSVSILPDCNTEAYNTARVNMTYFT